jgi:transcriptional regulatory protein LevR
MTTPNDTFEYLNKLYELQANVQNSYNQNTMKDEYIQYYSKYFDEFVKQGQSPDKIREHMMSYLDQVYGQPYNNFSQKIEKLIEDTRDSTSPDAVPNRCIYIKKQFCKNYC